MATCGFNNVNTNLLQPPVNTHSKTHRSIYPYLLLIESAKGVFFWGGVRKHYQIISFFLFKYYQIINYVMRYPIIFQDLKHTHLQRRAFLNFQNKQIHSCSLMSKFGGLIYNTMSYIIFNKKKKTKKKKRERPQTPFMYSCNGT